MEESAEEEQKREEKLRMYHACKEAIRIIGDVSMETSYQPAPPPIKNDWTIRNTQPSPTPMAAQPRPVAPPPAAAMGARPVIPPNPSRGAPPPPGRPAPNVPGVRPQAPPARPNPGLPPPLIPT